VYANTRGNGQDPANRLWNPATGTVWPENRSQAAQLESRRNSRLVQKPANFLGQERPRSNPLQPNQVLAPSRGLMPSAYPVRKVPGIRRNTSRVTVQRAKLTPSESLRFPLCKRKLSALQWKITIHSMGACRPEYVGTNLHLSHSERPSRRLPRIFPRGAGNATRRPLSRVRVLIMQVARGVDTAAK